MIPDFNEPNYLDIGKYLGIVDWSKIPVDTPIIVRNNMSGREVMRHFCKYENDLVHYYSGGCTSWSCKSYGDFEVSFVSCKNVRLAGGDDEN